MVRLGALLLVGSACLASLASAASVYPTTYPFDKELDVNVPPTFKQVEGLEKDMGNAANPGGYYARLQVCDPYADDRLNIKLGHTTAADARVGFNECRAASYYMFKQFKMEGRSIGTRNCSTGTSERHTPFVKGRPTSMKLSGVEYCKDGECCPMYKDTVSATGWGVKSLVKLDDIIKTGGCPKLESQTEISETVVCNQVWVGYNCNTYYTGGKTKNTREVIRPCYNVKFAYYVSCKLFTNAKVYTETVQLDRVDTLSWIAAATAKEVMAASNIFESPDRVCHPLSYYVPSAAKKTETPKGDGNSPPSPAAAVSAYAVSVAVGLMML